MTLAEMQDSSLDPHLRSTENHNHRVQRGPGRIDEPGRYCIISFAHIPKSPKGATDKAEHGKTEILKYRETQ